VHHRHLLPNEVDLLLDEETGFGMQPLREHVRGCTDCRARLEQAKHLASALAELPLMSPRFGLADRVMAQVPVFVPWHVTARDSVRQWVPTGPLARGLAAVLVGVVGTVITGLTLWIATRGDMVSLITGLAGEGARNAASRAAGDVVFAVFGPQTIGAVQQIGPIGLAFVAGGFVLTSLATVFGLRRIATSNRTRS
jgi:hypothetical protein